MRHIFRAIVLAIALLSGASPQATAASGNLFPYPVPPDTMMALQPRCDFIVGRFWERCNFGSAFRNPDALNAAFGDWVSIMPHASADTVHAAVNRLLERFAKKGPETLALATMAENWMYSDTAPAFSEEVYLPFARAAAANKKIGKAEKARFALHKGIIESSGVGATVPDMAFTRPDGSRGNLGEIHGSSILLFINDPDCSDCNLARVRLSADYNTRELISRGELTIVSIYPDEPSDTWKAEAAEYPSEWVVCAIPDADLHFDLRNSPEFLFLNSRHKVLIKGIGIDYLLGAFRVANTATQERLRQEANSAAETDSTTTTTL